MAAAGETVARPVNLA